MNTRSQHQPQSDADLQLRMEHKHTQWVYPVWRPEQPETTVNQLHYYFLSSSSNFNVCMWGGNRGWGEFGKMERKWGCSLPQGAGERCFYHSNTQALVVREYQLPPELFKLIRHNPLTWVPVRVLRFFQQPMSNSAVIPAAYWTLRLLTGQSLWQNFTFLFNLYLTDRSGREWNDR